MTKYKSHLKRPSFESTRHWLDDIEPIDHSKPPNVSLLTAIKKAIYTSLGEKWVNVDSTTKGN